MEKVRVHGAPNVGSKNRSEQREREKTNLILVCSFWRRTASRSSTDMMMWRSTSVRKSRLTNWLSSGYCCGCCWRCDDVSDDVMFSVSTIQRHSQKLFICKQHRRQLANRLCNEHQIDYIVYINPIRIYVNSSTTAVYRSDRQALSTARYSRAGQSATADTRHSPVTNLQTCCRVSFSFLTFKNIFRTFLRLGL